MIRAENVQFTYPNGFQALRGLSFHIRAGEFVAVIGQNGAGKTTLLKLLNGLLKPTAGRILLGGLDTSRARVAELARKVGFLFQNPDHQIFLPTVREELAFGPKNLGLKGAALADRVAEAAAAAGLTPYLDVNPRQLSKGQRQRVALASVLAMQPEVLVLDEPTTGQDYREALEIMTIVKRLHRQGHTILLVSHDMEMVARFADRALVLGAGQLLLDGPVAQVFARDDILAATGLVPPQAMQLARPYLEKGLLPGVLTVEELYQALIPLLRGESGARQILPA
ncbi:MAG: energy-coupling factor transport system ATP-binding protein [Moorella sp. (in: firmicutes)]|uniref:Energy-coupling factor transporter ATP-binding protein EcfA2 n=1 Tax=Neomoorella thermoacetica TaxID=1525 RepID=A0A1J5NHD2_NEOTH|nr:energy-coupling factor transport system ATP-binding protein [Moorella sp. (in: firmicutes)]OIQ58457.1 energy-coupling factor transporter ATP-binding protein EcfA2 [Moorella thermoacetica]